MIGSLMKLQSISRPEGFFAEVAGDNNSFNKIRFNVIFYGTSHPFLSTYFATIGQRSTIGIFVFTFLHHRLHHLLKLVQITRMITWKCNCCIAFCSCDLIAWCFYLRTCFGRSIRELKLGKSLGGTYSLPPPSGSSPTLSSVFPINPLR